jgi:hypothetical protein
LPLFFFLGEEWGERQTAKHENQKGAEIPRLFLAYNSNLAVVDWAERMPNPTSQPGYMPWPEFGAAPTYAQYQLEFHRYPRRHLHSTISNNARLLFAKLLLNA